MDRNAQAQAFLQGYANGLVGEHIRFNKALQQARLDFSPSSLNRITVLLSQIRQRLKPVRDAFLSDPASVQFLQVLSFYLGEYFARAADQPVHWLDEAAAVNAAAELQLPDPHAANLIGRIGGLYLVPFTALSNLLFTGNGKQSCAQYAETVINALTAKAQYDKDRQCTEYLSTFLQTGTLPGGLAFAELLRAAALDYSLESLSRIDALLHSIKQTEKPDRAAFIAQPANVNFLLLSAFYLVSTIARCGRFYMRWLDYEETKQSFKDAPPDFEVSTNCLINGRIYFPLATLSRILFDADSQTSCEQWARTVMDSLRPSVIAIRRTTASTADETDPAWLTAVRQMGFAAAYSLSLIEGGTAFAPTMLLPQGEQASFVTLMDESFEEALSHGNDRLNSNPDNLPYQLLMLDGYANLPTGKTDALLINLHCYTGQALSSERMTTALRFQVAVPYRKVSHPDGFAIYSPKLVTSTVSPHFNDAFSAAFYQGVDSFSSDTFAWNACLDEQL